MRKAATAMTTGQWLRGPTGAESPDLPCSLPIGSPKEERCWDGQGTAK